MERLFGSATREEENEWLSVSDLMAGLMIIFLFIAIVFIRPLAEQNLEIKEIARTWQENELEIYRALLDEFEKDLPLWNAEIEKETLLIRFKSPDVLFEQGASTIRPEFAAILKNFFPRYVRVLQAFKDSIEEVRIEGHTSSVWNRNTTKDEAYFLNMELSQSRTRAVLQKVMSLSEVKESRVWLRPLLTANGLSSSRLVINKKGREDRERSRRVEFRIRTTARSEIVRILEASQ
jgi:outer membrane protein OmpA-like peptidoglycan-associated protein